MCIPSLVSGESVLYKLESGGLCHFSYKGLGDNLPKKNLSFEDTFEM